MQAALLYEMLAARQLGAGNPAMTDLIARLGATGGAVATDDVIGQLTQTNPMLAVLAKHLGASVQSPSNDSALEIEGEAAEVSDTASAPEPDESRDPEAPAQIEALRIETDVLRERLDRCAAALGACGVCWGTDPSCRACRGRGQAGFCQPDQTLFEEMVLPAVDMLKAVRAISAKLSPALRPERIEAFAHEGFDRDFT